MGLFDPPAVKELRKQAQFIGGMHGQVFLGQIAPADLTDLLHHADWRQRIHEAFAAAAAEVGDEKARKAARKAANLGADSYARLGNGPYNQVVKQAEANVLAMLEGD